MSGLISLIIKKIKTKNDVKKIEGPNNSFPTEDPPKKTEEKNEKENKEETEIVKYRDQGKLYVGELCDETTTKNLWEYFDRFGKVIDAVALKHPKTGKSRGFGFVTFADPADADAVLKVEAHILNGKKIQIRNFSSKKLDSNNRVFLGGLPSDIDKEHLKKFFSRYGEVAEIRIPFNRENNKPKGYGFLSFVNESAMKKCLLDGFVYIGGRRIVIKRAEPSDSSKANCGFSIEKKADSISLCECEDERATVSVGKKRLPASEEKMCTIDHNPESNEFHHCSITKLSDLNVMEDQNTKEEEKLKVPDDGVEALEKFAEFFMKPRKEEMKYFFKDDISYNTMKDFFGNEVLSDFLKNLANQEEELKAKTQEEELKAKTQEEELKAKTQEEELKAKTQEEELKAKAQKNKFKAQAQKNKFKAQAQKNKFTAKAQEDKLTSSEKTSSSESPFYKNDEFLNVQNPLETVQKNESLFCTVCQWTPADGTTESFLIHCKTPTHRLKIKNRFFPQSNENSQQTFIPLELFRPAAEMSPEFKKLTNENSVSKLKLNQDKSNEQTRQKYNTKPEMVKSTLDQVENKMKKLEHTEGKEHSSDQQNVKRNKKKKTKPPDCALEKDMVTHPMLSKSEFICPFCKQKISESDFGILTKKALFHLKSHKE